MTLHTVCDFMQQLLCLLVHVTLCCSTAGIPADSPCCSALFACV